MSHTATIEINDRAFFGNVARSPVLKRTLDIVGALAALTLFAPVFLATAIAIKMELSGPVFFRQTRVGRNGLPFSMMKFRSMVVGADALHAKMQGAANSRHEIRYKNQNDPRVTRVGRFIRKYSIDELPQFWNVLIGDMSLVGPRPALPSEVARVCPQRPGSPGREARDHMSLANWRTRQHRLRRSGCARPPIYPRSIDLPRSLDPSADPLRCACRRRRLLETKQRPRLCRASSRARALHARFGIAPQQRVKAMRFPVVFVQALPESPSPRSSESRSRAWMTRLFIVPAEQPEIFAASS